MALDLTDDDVRGAVTQRLSVLYAGRPVILAYGVLAAATPLARWLRGIGCRVLVVCTTRGAGEVPGADEAAWVEVPAPATRSVTEELRTHDRLYRSLPPAAVEAVEAFDPDRDGVWIVSPFVTTDEPILGRPVTGGRPDRLPRTGGQAAGRADLDGGRRRGRPAPRRAGRPCRAGLRQRRGGRSPRRGVVGRQQARLQRRRQFRALGRRRSQPRVAGRCVRLLRPPLRPGAGDAVPRGRALLDPRHGPPRRHRRLPPGRDRRACATRCAGASSSAGWPPPGTRPRRTARRCGPPYAGSASTCARRTAIAAPSASTAS